MSGEPGSGIEASGETPDADEAEVSQTAVPSAAMSEEAIPVAPAPQPTPAPGPAVPEAAVPGSAPSQPVAAQAFAQQSIAPPAFAPQPIAPFRPAKPRTPLRHRLGALAALAVGLTAGALALTTIHSAPPPATPPPTHDERVRALWRTEPADAILPPTVDQAGDRYLRLGVDRSTTCGVLSDAFRAQLATDAPGAPCVAVLRATYTDATQTVLVTVGVVVVGGPPQARDKVWREWTPDSDSRRPAMMPGVLPVAGTVAAGFADAQRVSWSSQPSKDGSYLVYAVAGFADRRAGSTPDQLTSNTGKALAGDSPPVQAALDMSATVAHGVDTLAGAAS